MSEAVTGRYFWRGYVKVKTSRGWMLEHRWVMEQHLGRLLRSNEHVHHLDGDGQNNDIDNLVLLSASEHARLHSAGRPVSEEQKEKIRATLTGVRHSEERRANVSKAMTGKKRKPHSEETRRRIGEANRRANERKRAHGQSHTE